MCSVVSDSLWPHALWPTSLLSPWDFPGKNAGVHCHFLPQGNLPDPGIEPVSLTSPALVCRFFTTNATWEAHSPGISGVVNLSADDFPFLLKLPSAGFKGILCAVWPAFLGLGLRMYFHPIRFSNSSARFKGQAFPFNTLRPFSPVFWCQAALVLL